MGRERRRVFACQGKENDGNEGEGCTKGGAAGSRVFEGGIATDFGIYNIRPPPPAQRCFSPLMVELYTSRLKFRARRALLRRIFRVYPSYIQPTSS